MTKKLKLNLSLYKKVYGIRSAELGITRYYAEDEMKTPMHMSMGEEAITAGLCEALGKKHQAFGYYRSHALFISKTGDFDQFFAEMYGKATGVVRGKGGSMHLAAPEHGLLGVTAIVASTIAPAVGAAFANKMKRNGKVVAGFFGDGAIEEGVSLESLNVACLMQLPVIFVCEDNGLAVDVTAKERQGFKSIADVVKAYRCLFLQSESTDAEVIYDLAQKALHHIRTKKTPVFMHLKYYRILKHIGVISDFDTRTPRKSGGFEKMGYRSEKERRAWLKRDPVRVLRSKLLRLGVKEAAIQKIESTIDRRVEQGIQKAKRAPFPKLSEVHDCVFASECTSR